MGVEAGAAERRGPISWWGKAFSLGGDAGLKLDQSVGLKGELGMGLKLEAEAGCSGSP